MLYAYEITKVNEKYVGYVPDLEFKTKPQDTEENAETVLTDGLSAFIEVVYRKEKRMIPLPKLCVDGKKALYVPIKLQFRILLWNLLRKQKISQKELADKLGVSTQMVNQMLNGKGNVSAERYEEIFQTLGVYPHLEIIHERRVHNTFHHKKR